MKCLIVDHMHDSTTILLEGVGLEVDYRPMITRNEIIEIAHNYDGIIIRSKTPIDSELISVAKNLKFVGRAGAGVDNLNVDLLESKGIKIINAPEGNRNALAEHTVGLLLSLLHKIVKADDQVRSGVWDREGNRGVELAGKKVGLLGYGFMGQAFARKLKVFGCEVMAYDKYKSGFGDEYCKEATLQEIYDECDVFSIHVPLTTETKMMVDEDYLNSFKKRIYLLNTSRGEVLSLSACCNSLKKGKILGIGLDVLENERLDTLSPDQQMAFDTLAKSDKAILTPHVAGWSFESFENISKVLVTKIKDHITQKS